MNDNEESDKRVRNYAPWHLNSARFDALVTPTQKKQRRTYEALDPVLPVAGGKPRGRLTQLQPVHDGLPRRTESRLRSVL